MARSDEEDQFGDAGIDLVVFDRRFVADGVVELTLRRPEGDGRPLPTWEPGAHIDLHLSGGMVRQYSLHGDPSDQDEWKISVLRKNQGRGGSKFIHDQLRKGSRVKVTGLRKKILLRGINALCLHRRGNRYHAAAADAASRRSHRRRLEALLRWPVEIVYGTSGFGVEIRG